MKGLILLKGESFRDGGQDSRKLATEEAYINQKKATKSHLLFLRKLLSQNVHVDLNITTYNTVYTDELLKWYSDEFNIIRACINDNATNFDQVTPIQDSLLSHVINTDSSTSLPALNSYNFIFFLRFDCALKSKFINIFDLKWNTIRFPFVRKWQQVYDYSPSVHKLNKIKEYISKTNLLYFPVVSDVLWYVPRKYIDRLFNTSQPYAHPWHSGWADLITNYSLSFNDMDVMLNTMHQSNTQFGANPLYSLISRNEYIGKDSNLEIFDKNNIQPFINR